MGTKPVSQVERDRENEVSKCARTNFDTGNRPRINE